MDLRKILLENWSIKLLSLSLTLSLWVYVTSTGKTELTMSIPIEIRNIPKGMILVGNVAGSLEVRVQGRERVLKDSAVSRKMVALLDLTGTKEGEHTVHISPDDIKRPAGIVVTYLAQPEVKVKLEPVMRKAFRLRPVLQGVPAPGYRVAGTSVSPPRITIEGPASAVKQLHRVETMPISIQKVKGNITVEPRIDYQGQPVKLMEKNVLIHVMIERILNEKTVRH